MLDFFHIANDQYILKISSVKKVNFEGNFKETQVRAGLFIDES